MRLGTFHKKKKYIINKVKINILSFLFSKKKRPNFKVDKIKKCLIVHDNSKLGDLIVLSSLYRELYNRNIEVYLLSNQSGHAFLEDNKHISGFIIKKSSKLKDFLTLRSQLKEHNFDIVFDPFETFPSFFHSLLLVSIKADFILGFDKWYRRYYNVYHPHDENLKEHMSARAKIIYDFTLGGAHTDFEARYDLPYSAEIENEVKEFIGDSAVLIINPFGAKKICRLTEEQITTIFGWIKTRYPELRIVFTGHPDDLQGLKVSGAERFPFRDFNYTVALTRLCRYVISVDTALVHIASGYDKPLLAFYPKSRQEEYLSHEIWAPNNPNALQVVSPTYNAGDIPIADVESALEAFFSREK